MAGHRRRSRQWPRRLTSVLMAVMLAGAGLAVASRVLGVRALVEHSDSMYPAIATGDLVLARDIRAEAARPGDIVTFPDLSRGGELITHRVTAVRAAGGVLVFTTRGDANTGDESWTAVPDARIGRAAGVVPLVGRIFAPLSRPAVAASVNGVLVVMLVLLIARFRDPGRRRKRRPGSAGRQLVGAP